MPSSQASHDIQSSSQSVKPADAARLAAERRLASPPTNPHSTSSTSHSQHFDPSTFDPSRQDQLPFFRLLDSVILPNTSKSQAVQTLDLLATVIGNILNPPNPAASGKYRQLRLTNSQVKSNIVDVKGSEDYLIQAGFQKKIEDFVPYLTFSPSPSASTLYTLRVSLHVLKIVLKRAQEAAERQERYRASEQDAEQQRKQKALLGFEEDRRLRKEKDDRERIARDARLERERREQQEQQRQQQQTREQDDAHNIERRSESLPAYNDVVGGGRVLGTGEVVSGPTSATLGISNQDLESDDDDDDY
ncbi:hypothetical protein OIO90_004068 [Microbotryomycetes sp. JL221]|nr:hypothetical protein OIO90_004068 [Microbotryomycetes sp. JL221]